MRHQLDEWQEKFPDQGGIPEKDLIKRWWNGKNQPPVTAMPKVKAKNGKLYLSCATPGASIGWRIIGENSWQVYSGPFRAPNQTIAIMAMRIGYSVSETTTY